MFKRSWVQIPAPYTWWTFFTLICCKNCIVCLKRPKINEKEAGVGPFLKRNTVTKYIFNDSKKTRLFLHDAPPPPLSPVYFAPTAAFGPAITFLWKESHISGGAILRNGFGTHFWLQRGMARPCVDTSLSHFGCLLSWKEKSRNIRLWINFSPKKIIKFDRSDTTTPMPRQCNVIVLNSYLLTCLLAITIAALVS